jgi:RHS repeat-associated protein
VTAYQYQYDLAGRLTQVDNAGSVVPEVTLSMAYDYEGNRTWLSDSQGGSVWYAWNNQRLQSMALYTADYKSAQVGFGYDSVGRLSSLTRTANGDFATPVTTSFTLDLLDRVTGITHSKGIGEDASTLSQFGYAFDANSRVTNYTGPEGSLSYALDTNGQLLSVTGSRSEDYALDANGNRTSNTTTAGNLLLNDGKYSYTYDLEGNQKTKTRISDGQLTEYFWDHRNQLTKALVKDANGVLLKELRFTYDVEGRRVGSWVDADGAGPEEPDQVWTVFDGVNPYMDFDGDGLLKTRYLYGPGIDELFARIGSGEDPQWYLADRLGSVRQIVDGAGTILDEISYDSFGGILSESNPSQGDRFKFTGREYSPELGIYYYRARWYDPSSGRFISQDPIGFQAGDANLYRYVGNAPGDGVDPEGLEGPWRGYPYGPKDVPPKPVSFGWITSVGNFLYEGMDLVFLEPVRMGGDLLRAGEFGVENYFGWNPNEPDWRSRLARDVSQGDKSNRDIFFDHEKENIVRGACLIGGKVAGDFLGKSVRWFRNRWSVAPNAVRSGQYLAGKAPRQVTLGTRILEGQYVDDLGRVQPWRAHYDQYGRLIARTDFKAGNTTQGIPNVHHHVYEYNAQFPLGREVQSHVPGEYMPR